MMEANESGAFTSLMPRLLASLRQRWWLMPLGALVMVGLMFLYVLRAQPVWQRGADWQGLPGKLAAAGSQPWPAD